MNFFIKFMAKLKLSVIIENFLFSTKRCQNFENRRRIENGFTPDTHAHYMQDTHTHDTRTQISTQIYMGAQLKHARTHDYSFSPKMFKKAPGIA